MKNIEQDLLTVNAEIMLKSNKMQGEKQQELLDVLGKYGLSKVYAMKALIELTEVIEEIKDLDDEDE